MLFEVKEVPLKLRFSLLTCKFLIKSLAREFNPVIESLDLLRLAAIHRNIRIHFLRSFLIFRHYISIQHYRNIIYSSPFLPFFFYDFETALLTIRPCRDMFPTDSNLSRLAINKKFLKKSFQYRNNAVSFYIDGSKLNKDSPSGVDVFSPDLNLRIIHKLPAETSVFTAEAWAILFAVNAISNFNCAKAVIFQTLKVSWTLLHFFYPLIRTI